MVDTHNFDLRQRSPSGRSANDETYSDRSAALGEAERLIELMLDPPAEFPCKASTIKGLVRVLSDLTVLLPDAAKPMQRIVMAAEDLEDPDPHAARSQAIAAFSRRKKYHLHYLGVLHVGLNSLLKQSLPREAMQPVHQILGSWCLRHLLDGWRPSNRASAKVVNALSRPNSGASSAWSMEQRQRAAADAVHELRIAIQKNSSTAAGVGLTSSGVKAEAEPSGIEAFNTRFRRRMSDLLEYKSADMQAGSGGNGALSAAGLKRAGRELMTGIRAGRFEEIHVSLEVLSHLTSELVQLLPVQLGTVPPEGALAWLDVPGGAYNHVLFKLVEKGARPVAGTEGLYEVTTQVVQIQFSPPLADALRGAAKKIDGETCSVNQLLGSVSHGPHDAVAGEGPYRVTASKLQASLPALLLQEGEFRWATSLVTSSPFLISRGRPAYGIGRQADIDQVTDHAHDLLAWPRPRRLANRNALIGSFTTPRVLAVGLAFAALAREADASTDMIDDVDGIFRYVNAHAAYMAMLMALTFALRDRVAYKLPTSSLRARVPMKFNDKDVHEFSMPAVPILGIIVSALDGWETLLLRAVALLRKLGSPDANTVADRIELRLRDQTSDGWVFTISVASTLEPVGTRTWRDLLPRGLRLVGNFGRQFWPFRLAAREVCQSDVDLLMRHQMTALHPGSTHICVPEADIHERLVAAMTQVIEQDLQLAIPQAFLPTVAE